jgi:DNA-directed RNA polymerase subunit F
MIKNKKDFIKSLSKIRPEDEDDLRFVVDRVQKIIDSSNVSEESIKELFNVIQLLLMLHGKFVDYNILWLKQGYMED